MKEYFDPNDYVDVTECDSDAINLAVKEARASGVNRVLITGVNKRTGCGIWNISRAILLPSDIEIVIDNAILRQADGSFDNIFRTENTFSELSSCLEENIHIRGVGEAVLDGGVPNGLTESTSCKAGFPHVIRNNMILITNTKGFSISGITFRDMRWWAINLIHATDGTLSALAFDAKDNIPNQDGIDLRIGCRNILIENIKGAAGDDLIALSGFRGFERALGFDFPDVCPDIYDIKIRQVEGTSVSKAVIAIRNHDGVKIHNIDIDGVYDTSHIMGHKPYATLRIGQKTYSNFGFSTLSDTSFIRARNIHTFSGDAIMVNVTLEDSSFEEVYLKDCARCAFTTDSDWMPCGAVLSRVALRGVYDESSSSEPLIRLVRESDVEFVRDFSISNIYSSESRQILTSEYEGVFLG